MARPSDGHSISCRSDSASRAKAVTVRGTELTLVLRGVRRWFRQALGLVVAVSFLYLAFGGLEWESIRVTLTAAAPGPVLLACVALAVSVFVRIVRWWWMLRALEPALPLPCCMRPFLVSMAVNNTVPFRAGDLVRAVGFCDELRSPPMRVFATLIIERLLDLIVLLAFFFVGLLGVAGGAFPSPFVKAGVWIGAACLVGLLGLVVVPNRVRQTLAWVMRQPWSEKRSWTKPAIRWVEQLFDAFSLLRFPALSVQLLALSIVAWAFEGGVFAAIALSLFVEAGAFGPWFSLATGTLATLLPSAPGYVGTFEYFTMMALVAYGATKATAAAFALLVHLILWAPVTVVGILFVATLRGRTAWRRARVPHNQFEMKPDE